MWYFLSFCSTHFNQIIFQFQFCQTPQLGKNSIADECQLVRAHSQRFEVAETLEGVARQLVDAVVGEQQFAELIRCLERVILYHLKPIMIEI